jgi:ribonuclease HI
MASVADRAAIRALPRVTQKLPSLAAVPGRRERTLGLCQPLQVLQSSAVNCKRIKVFFDGGCRPNPGRIEVAVVLRGVSHRFDDLGYGGSEDAEWLALIQAVKVARSFRLAEVELFGDAKDIVRRARAALKDGTAQRGHAAAFRAAVLEAAPMQLSVRWIKRQQNLAGIALAARHPR